ncbi:putative bifunctional diguanylate cyclase/phosphodiesterase [Rhizorhapis suberifaciens]|uniref:Diguanylate cyclase (GGDEF)-like protein n=1 Tax=Rhizorhapis suberifaciens TaxID=13656 RepID=A0A840HX08_9SPHN|nr:bifunctional diguanylate cyclase/phosphodiesterase [Rhizorhapis suberifaciens]MBB4642902.1 diguanylate cyclase (GGDEF)-like protein [Rhizorhapis suberifaciens]
MEGVSLKSRAIAFAASAGAVAFILALLAGTGGRDDVQDISRALIMAILCGVMCWASAMRTVSGLATSVDLATERLTAAAHGDLAGGVPSSIKRDLPELSVAMESLFSQVRTNLDNIHRLAMYDPVTSLPNRTSFCRQVERLIADLPPHGLAALFFIDLDGFKLVNDTLGHAAGDQLLSRVAGRLREVVMIEVGAGSGDAVVGRLAGDEFTLFFPYLPAIETTHRIARAVQYALGERFDIGGQQVNLGASIGVAFHPEHGDTLHGLLRSADVAMYHAKENGRGRVQFFNKELASLMEGRAELERDLRIGLERDEFLLQFQPQLDITTGRIIAAEALVRWKHPDRDMMLPGSFVPVAEETGLMVELGDWIMDKVCATAAGWARRGISQRLAINVSTRELAQPDFFARLRHAMDRHGITANQLELEITETLAMDMDQRVLTQVRALRREGIKIAIDDFGTGFSNLSRLKDLPVDRVKIDRSLVRDIVISPEARTICSAVIGLIQGLGLEVVVEGVEKQDQMDMLRIIGCSIFQGYLFSMPEAEPEYLHRFSGAWAPIELAG